MSTLRSPAGFNIRDVPGIIYDPIDDRARIQGTGLEVFEIVRIYQSVGEDWEGLRAACDWLTEEQLRAALTFATVNPEYVQAEEQKDAAVPDELEKLWRDYPSTRPPRR
jgi:uncharacterized protein (DUF433 family)